MLTMEQIYHIRFEHREKDKSLRSIAQETGFNFRTVRKYVEREGFYIKKKAIHTRRGKLDPYKETIDKWLTEDLKSRPQKGILRNVFKYQSQKISGCFYQPGLSIFQFFSD